MPAEHHTTLTPDTPVRYLKGVGPKTAERFEKLGIVTLADLLCHYPRRYIDFSRPYSKCEPCYNQCHASDRHETMKETTMVDSTRSRKQQGLRQKGKKGHYHYNDGQFEHYHAQGKPFFYSKRTAEPEQLALCQRTICHNTQHEPDKQRRREGVYKPAEQPAYAFCAQERA